MQKGHVFIVINQGPGSMDWYSHNCGIYSKLPLFSIRGKVWCLWLPCL